MEYIQIKKLFTLYVYVPKYRVILEVILILKL